MARTSKFTFPLPGRSLQSTKSSNTAEPSSNPIDEISQMANGKQSKAARLLGATDFKPLDKKPKSARPTKPLKEKPSFASTSVSELNQELAVNGDEILEPVATTDNWMPPRLSPRGLFPRPSSPLLGRHIHESSTRTEKRAVSPNNGLHQSRSSSTLRSYYDPANSPLSVSQQTSASSARDMALRKGSKLVTDSQYHSETQNDTGLTGTSSSEQTPRCETPRKRPPRLDFSRLFPRPQMFGGSLLSPHRVTKSPSTLSMASDILPPTPTYAKETSSRASISRGSLSASNDNQALYFASPVEPTIKPKVSLKPPGQDMHHWFTGTEEDDHLDGPAWKPSREAVRNIQCAPTIGMTSSSGQDPLPRPLPKSQFSPYSSNSQETVMCLSSPFGEVNSMQSPTSPQSGISRKSTGRAFTNSNLQTESVLALSSSEDEDESDGEASTCNSQHCHRNVAASAKRHVTVTRGGANSTPALRPVKLHAHSDSILSSGSRSSAISGRNHIIAGSNGLPRATFLRPPSISYTRQKRAPENRVSESSSEDLRPKSSNDATSRSSIPLGSFGPAPASPSRSDSGLQLRKSRIMAVTREEESLLEAMRQKKASMRQNKTEAIHNQTSEQDSARPVSNEYTANLAVSEKRLRFAEQPLPVANPSTALNHEVTRSRTSGFLDSASISSEIWSNGRTSIGYLPVPNFSPNLHFTPSEYDSSTPPSRASPKTPPSEEVVSSMTHIDGSVVPAYSPADAVQGEVKFEHHGEGSPSQDVMQLYRNEAGKALVLGRMT